MCRGGVPNKMDYKRVSSGKSIGEEKASVVPRASGVVLAAPDAPASALDALSRSELARVGRGLSYVPYWTAQDRKHPKYEVTAWDGASLVEFKLLSDRVTRYNGAGRRRGVVKGLSDKSQARLWKWLDRVRTVQLVAAQFTTLTYPANFPSARASKRDLKVFLQRLARAYPEAKGLWKLEPQERGAPHYHLLVLGLGRLDDEAWRVWLMWLATTWYEVVGSGDIRHWAAGTSSERVKHPRAVGGYMSKYFSKKQDFEDSTPGRYWGKFGDLGSCLGDAVVFDATGAQVADMWRVADKLRLSVARAKVDPDRRAVAIGRARRRRNSRASRWYVCRVEVLMRYFLEGVLRS